MHVGPAGDHPIVRMSAKCSPCKTCIAPVFRTVALVLLNDAKQQTLYLARAVSTTLGKIVMTLMPCSFIAYTAHALSQPISR